MNLMEKSIEELHELLMKKEITSDDLVTESLKKSHRVNLEETMHLSQLWTDLRG